MSKLRAALASSLARISERLTRDDPSAAGQWLGRFVILRLLGLVSLMAFLTLLEQGSALLGPRCEPSCFEEDGGTVDLMIKRPAENHM